MTPVSFINTLAVWLWLIINQIFQTGNRMYGPCIAAIAVINKSYVEQKSFAVQNLLIFSAKTGKVFCVQFIWNFNVLLATMLLVWTTGNRLLDNPLYLQLFWVQDISFTFRGQALLSNSSRFSSKGSCNHGEWAENQDRATWFQDAEWYVCSLNTPPTLSSLTGKLVCLSHCLGRRNHPL